MNKHEHIVSAEDAPDSTRLARGGGITLVGRLLGRGLQVLAQAALARLLGPEDFGLYAIGWVLLYMGGLTEPLGLGYGMLKFGAQYWKTDDSRFRGVFFESLILGLLSGVLIGLFSFLAAPFLANSIFHKPDLAPVIQALSIAFPLKTGLTVCAAATRVSQKMRFSTYSLDIAQPLSNAVFIYIFITLGWGLQGAVLATTASFGIGFALAFYFVYRLFPAVFQPIPKPIWNTRALISFSVPASISNMLSNLTNRMDRLLMGVFRSSAEVGVYQSASQVSFIAGTILESISTMFTPMVAVFFHNDQDQRLDEVFKVSTKWAFYLSMPVCLILISQPANMLGVVFGDSYRSGGTALAILAAAQLFNAGTGSVGTIMVMTGQQKTWLVVSALSLAIDILVGVILIPTLGMIGAAIGSAASIVVLYLIGLWRVKVMLGIWPYDRRFLKGVIAGGITAAVLFIWSKLAPPSPLWSLSIASALAFVIPVALLLLMGLDQEDRAMLDTYFTKLRPKSVP